MCWVRLGVLSLLPLTCKWRNNSSSFLTFQLYWSVWALKDKSYTAELKWWREYWKGLLQCSNGMNTEKDGWRDDGGRVRWCNAVQQSWIGLFSLAGCCPPMNPSLYNLYSLFLLKTCFICDLLNFLTTKIKNDIQEKKFKGKLWVFWKLEKE